uniref:Si:dkey-4p15.5 n=1 Tax=Hucho hucho TaxID=62062 RepID=A0A4W5QP69_9TELE
MSGNYYYSITVLLLYHIVHYSLSNGSYLWYFPVNSDITVTCGTEVMELSILLCPVYFGGYNETLMALNAQFILPECHGIPDWNIDPPILKFNLSITADAITNEVGAGLFSDFSNVQFVNISGIINSLDPSAAIVTYRRQIIYMFSCRYPLQYLVNNSKVTVLAVRDNNGSFVSTLSMWLYSDTDYTQQLIVPENGINLKTRIFVGVKATSLTERFHVLLDRCYASTSPVPNNSTYYDLFVGCTRDGKTRVELNGASQNAHFSFEAFRFIEHKNMPISTFYLHCVTRLCEVSSCSSLLPNCSGSSRRKREAQEVLANNQATISSGPIKTKVDDGAAILYQWCDMLADINDISDMN